MISIPLENEYRIRRGIHGCWVLEKYMGKNKKDKEIWKHHSTCNEMKNLFVKLIDNEVVMSDDMKSNLLEIQEAYDTATEKISDVVSRIDLSSQYESTIQDLEEKVKELTVQNNNLKTRIKMLNEARKDVKKYLIG